MADNIIIIFALWIILAFIILFVKSVKTSIKEQGLSIYKNETFQAILCWAWLFIVIVIFAKFPKFASVIGATSTFFILPLTWKLYKK